MVYTKRRLGLPDEGLDEIFLPNKPRLSTINSGLGTPIQFLPGGGSDGTGHGTVVVGGSSSFPTTAISSTTASSSRTISTATTNNDSTALPSFTSSSLFGGSFLGDSILLLDDSSDRSIDASGSHINDEICRIQEKQNHLPNNQQQRRGREDTGRTKSHGRSTTGSFASEYYQDSYVWSVPGFDNDDDHHGGDLLAVKPDDEGVVDRSLMRLRDGEGTTTMDSFLVVPYPMSSHLSSSSSTNVTTKHEKEMKNGRGWRTQQGNRLWKFAVGRSSSLRRRLRLAVGRSSSLRRRLRLAVGRSSSLRRRLRRLWKKVTLKKKKITRKIFKNKNNGIIPVTTPRERPSQQAFPGM